jgi:integrase
MAGRRRPSVTVDQQPSGSWRVRWREHGRQLQDGGFPTQDEAQDHADTIRQRLRTGLPGTRDPRSIGAIVEHWWDTFVTTGSVEAATRQGYRNDARRILETIGTESAHTTSGKIRTWRNTVAQRYGPRAANKAHTALSSAYQRALEADPPLVESNPCRGITRLAEPTQDVVPPTRLQIEYMERTAPSPRELAILMIGSRGGLRQSELFGLAWRNMSTKAVRVAEVADPVTRRIRQSTKTKRSERRVPLPPRTLEAIAAIRPPGRPTGPMFPSPTDPTRPMARSAYLRVYWNRWVRTAAWLAASENQPEDVWGGLVDLKFKFLRHHAISRWAAGGASITQVSRWSGDSIATIDKHYAYLFDDDEDDVMQAVD